MTKMLGRAGVGQCPTCRAGAGPDCIDTTKSKRQVRYMERAQWRRDADDELAQEIVEQHKMAPWSNWQRPSAQNRSVGGSSPPGATHGPVAQPVEALDLRSRGCGFDPRRGYRLPWCYKALWPNW